MTHTFVLTNYVVREGIEGEEAYPAQPREAREYDDDDRKMTCDGGFFSWAWIGCNRRRAKMKRAV